ncbi:hypothetical protein EK21DRAFT_109237 [Setomelanomma holmii]|uniref:Uncharacterized protein n=1 Tax=Setomelanomma holmii TaxID=210430 RepID=A0A9P4HE26_9PLEO|nr:hypothetical protein EK21DRAFT_109237 [Setomelanomma holmii]
MSSPLAGTDSNSRQLVAKSTKGSKIPTSRPSSQMTSIEGRRTPLTISATGSPLPTVPLPPRDTVSPTPASKIPKKAGYVSAGLVAKNAKPSLGSGSSHNSGRPTARGLSDTATVTPRSNLAYKKSNPLLSRNKPLPSPPIAQVINPNSPPKAQRTLVDAEAGTPSDEVWPILQPETFSPLRTTSSRNLPEPEKQQQRRSVSGSPHQLVTANTLVKNRPVTASAALSARSNTSSSRRKSLAGPQEPSRPTIEERRFSSNNPFGKAFHAYSPASDVAIASPLARKSSAPLAIQVPPRMSSKRASLPLLDTNEPNISTQKPSHEVKQGTDDWPLHKSEHGEISDDELVGDDTSVNAVDAAHTSDNADAGPGSRLSDVSITDPLNPRSDDLTVKPFYDPETGYRTKILSWKRDQPNRGPVLRIHKDADALVLGIGDLSDDQSDAEGKHTERMSLGRSLGAFAQRMSKQAKPKVILEPHADTSTTTCAPVDIDKSGSVKISPLRSFAPQRQSSARLPPWSPPSRNVQSSNNDRSYYSPSTLGATTSGLVRGEASYVTSVDPVSSVRVDDAKTAIGASAARPMAADAEDLPTPVKNLPKSPIKKAKKALGLSRGVPSNRSSMRMTPSWMAPTVSSQKSRRASVEHGKAGSPRRMSGRMSSRDVSSLATASGSASPISRRTAQSTMARRPSKLRASMSATPPSERSTGAISATRSTQTGPELLPKSSLSSPSNTDPAKQPQISANVELKTTAATKVKAKRSFRSMFYKTNTTSTEKMPKMPDPKRASIATSGKTLAKRISKNLSKGQLPYGSESKTTIQTSTEAQEPIIDNDANMHDPTAPPEGTSSNAASGNSLAFQFDPAAVLTKLTNTVTSMPANDPDRVRLLEMAEAVLHCVETSNQAKLSCESARKHARDAEVNYARIQLEVGRIHKMCAGLI